MCQTHVKHIFLFKKIRTAIFSTCQNVQTKLKEIIHNFLIAEINNCPGLENCDWLVFGSDF